MSESSPPLDWSAVEPDWAVVECIIGHDAMLVKRENWRAARAVSVPLPEKGER